MILSQTDLREAVKNGVIGFSPPLEDRQWGEASIDLRLGFQFTKLRKCEGIKFSIADGLSAIGGLKIWDTMELSERDNMGKTQHFILEPGEFVLAKTYESITVPKNLIAFVEGRSTYARMGLSMHQTAPWIQPGWTNTPIILEVMNNGPLEIVLTPLKDRPCQITFFELKTEVPAPALYGTRSTDRYQGQTHPIPQGSAS
ncbi:MAG: dCTP deaminase [Acetobacteraceae bacterium]